MHLVQDNSATKPRPRSPRQPEVVKSAVRVIEVLEFFDRNRAPASVGQISSALQYPQSSTSALLRSLTRIGYLRYDCYLRTYFPTERVPLLGSAVARPWLRGGPLLTLMDSLAESCALPVALARRNGDCAQYIHVACVQPARTETFLGEKLPLATTAAGQVLLADHPEQEVRRLMHRLNAEARRPADAVHIDELMVRLAEVRQRGHSFTTNRAEAAIALRLPPDPENPSLALVLVGNHATIAHRVPALLSKMRESASKRLGPLHRVTADFAVPAEFALTPRRQVAQYPVR